MALKEYKEKRDFRKTQEPKGELKHSDKPTFVVQKHAARRLHYDVRIEHKGVLKSWAVPRGPSMDPKDKRLAVQTEDHPLDYANFAGTIPKGNYGAGEVEIWDKGTFENVGKKDGLPINLDQAFEKGHLRLIFDGKKMKGLFSFVKTKDSQWLLFKEKTNSTEETKEKTVSKKISDSQGPGEIWQISNPKKTGKIEEVTISNPDKILFPQSKITKKEFVDYYELIAPYILPHLKDRPLSMNRFPDGIQGEMFYQKEIPSYSPSFVDKTAIQHHEKKTTYAVCNNKQALMYLANFVIVPHPWLCRTQNLRNPDKMIFDLDPIQGHFEDAVLAARTLHDLFDDLELKSFVMSTGSKGLHVIVPLDAKLDFHNVSAFAKVIAKRLEDWDPKKFSASQRIEKRKGGVFVDTYRNAFAQTAVCAYAVRANENAPVAFPLEWKELSKKIDPQQYTIRNMQKRIHDKSDIFDTMYDYPQSLKEALEKVE